MWGRIWLLSFLATVDQVTSLAIETWELLGLSVIYGRFQNPTQGGAVGAVALPGSLFAQSRWFLNRIISSMTIVHKLSCIWKIDNAYSVSTVSDSTVKRIFQPDCVGFVEQVAPLINCSCTCSSKLGYGSESSSGGPPVGSKYLLCQVHECQVRVSLALPKRCNHLVVWEME